MGELQQIEVGQLWKSQDRRDNGMVKRVVRVIPMNVSAAGGGYAILQGNVRSTIRFSTLRKRYQLVQEALSED